MSNSATVSYVTNYDLTAYPVMRHSKIHHLRVARFSASGLYTTKKSRDLANLLQTSVCSTFVPKLPEIGCWLRHGQQRPCRLRVVQSSFPASSWLLAENTLRSMVCLTEP